MKIFEVNMQYFKHTLSVQTQVCLQRKEFNSLIKVYLDRLTALGNGCYEL